MRPVTPLALARIALGVVFLVRTTALVNLLPFPLAHVTGPLLGWPEQGWRFAWATMILPDDVRGTLCVVRTAAGLFFLLGVRARGAGIVAGLCGIVALSQDPFGFIFTLYTLFVGTLVLALTDATSALAICPEKPTDARRGLLLVHLFVASIYVWSGLAKMQGAWLSGNTLGALAEDGLLSPAVCRFLLAHGTLRGPLAVGVAAAELALPVMLLVRRTRTWGLGTCILLHAAFECSARPDVMGLVMISLLVSFLPSRASRHEIGQAPHRKAGLLQPS